MMETIHVVQPFTRTRAGSLVPSLAQQFSTPQAATARAEVIASEYAGIVAYSMDDRERLRDEAPSPLQVLGCAGTLRASHRQADALGQVGHRQGGAAGLLRAPGRLRRRNVLRHPLFALRHIGRLQVRVSLKRCPRFVQRELRHFLNRVPALEQPARRLVA